MSLGFLITVVGNFCVGPIVGVLTDPLLGFEPALPPLLEVAIVTGLTVVGAPVWDIEVS